MDTVASNPVEAWNLVVELINEAPSLSALTFVAAGPLESLIDKHGKLVIDSLEQSLCNNKRLQFAIVGVWLDEDDEMYAKLESLKQTYNLNEINPLNNSPWSETNPMPG